MFKIYYVFDFQEGSIIHEKIVYSIEEKSEWLNRHKNSVEIVKIIESNTF